MMNTTYRVNRGLGVMLAILTAMGCAMPLEGEPGFEDEIGWTQEELQSRNRIPVVAEDTELISDGHGAFTGLVPFIAPGSPQELSAQVTVRIRTLSDNEATISVQAVDSNTGEETRVSATGRRPAPGGGPAFFPFGFRGPVGTWNPPAPWVCGLGDVLWRPFRQACAGVLGAPIGQIHIEFNSDGSMRVEVLPPPPRFCGAYYNWLSQQ